ncbi:Protein RTM1 [Penicillium brasilianum]|uniref:Protein RTM1 n=1 Tax=Penicillium brasilianum TaxID=104259 RepID=A0A1S9R8C9_PENBI|nr:Protein RTM1 [Penicillium brasilianum]
MGGICARVLANSNPKSIPIYSIQTILILLAPPLYAASIYMILGRLIVHLRAESSSIVPLKWIATIFVTGDVIAFAMQAAGGGIMASGTISALKIGEHITIGGLCVQLVFFTIFVITAVIFHMRIRSRQTGQTAKVRQEGGAYIIRSWESILWGLYIASILILVRSVFRLVEYAQGNDGHLISHEAFMYVFDATLMFFAMVVMNVLHPSMVLSSSHKADRHSLEGQMEEQPRNSIYSTTNI